MTQGDTPTYLLVDGENIDATLGISVLGRRPNPDERPRWDRLRTWVRDHWGGDVTAMFFLNCSTGQMPMSFVQALLAMDYRPVPLSSDRPGDKVVDIGIQRTLEAIAERPGDVVLVSHDGDFLPQLRDVLDGERRVAVAGFREFVNAGFTELTADGLELVDLEDDVRCFTGVLPRVRIIPIDSFDPTRYL